jgi:hypothetical protein
LSRLRRKSNDSNYEDDEYETDTDEEGVEQFEEEVEMPIISNEGHYWIGKDYSNTYKADFKEVNNFSTGKRLLVI